MRPTTVLPALLSLLVSATTALAQQPDDRPVAYALGQITVTADSEPVAETAATTVVTAAEIRATGSRTVAEALAYAAGVTVTTGRKSEPTISLGGLDQTRVLVLVDGVPYYETNYGRLDLNQIPVEAVAQIEVTRGPASVLYGPNGLGGVVNIVTRAATEHTTWSFLAEGGANGTRRLALGAGGRAGGLAYRLDLTRRSTDGWELPDGFEPRAGAIVHRNPSRTDPAVLEDGGLRLGSDSVASGAWLKLGRDADPDRTWFVNLHWLDQEHGMAPAVDSVTVYHAPPAFSQLGRTPLYRDRGIDLDVRRRLSPRLVLKSKLFHHDHRDEYASYADLAFTDRIATSRFEDALSGASVVAEVRAGSADTVRVSAALREDRHDERDDSSLPFAETRSRTASLALENALALSARWSLVTGVSRDRFDVTDAERNLLSRDGAWTGRQDLPGVRTDRTGATVGLVRRLDRGGRLFASLGRATRFPTLQQLYSSKSGNAGLAPERATSAAGGVELRGADGARLELSAFAHDVEDMITRNAPTPENRYENYAEVRLLGLGLSGHVRAARWLSLRADWSWTNAEDRSPGRATDRVVGVAEHKGGLGVAVTLPRGARLDLAATWVGPMSSALPSPRYPADTERRVGGSRLIDARLALPLLHGVEVYVQGRNLLDEVYESEWAYPGPGRSLVGGLSGRF